MDDQANGQNTEDAIGNLLSTVSDTVGDLVTGIPAPIRKNALRAFTRLCTAAVEYPAALIESAITERRAESSARVKLINTSVEQIAQQMQTNPEYARAAVKKFGQKIIRERVNVDQIAQIAAEELRGEDSAKTTAETPDSAPVSEDWMSVFENEAAQMSSEEMQGLFARILAGEIRKPTTFSIRTVKILAQIDNTAAALFKKFCSLCISLQIPEANMVLDARVVSMGSAGSNSLGPYGLPFDQLNVLQEYGLVISDYNSWRDYRISVAQGSTVSMPMSYLNEQWAFVQKTPAATPPEFRVIGVALTRCGKELLSVVDKLPDEQYTAALKGFFDQQDMIMTRVGS
jgi:hypothetical protein